MPDLKLGGIEAEELNSKSPENRTDFYVNFRAEEKRNYNPIKNQGGPILGNKNEPHLNSILLTITEDRMT